MEYTFKYDCHESHSWIFLYHLVEDSINVVHSQLRQEVEYTELFPNASGVMPKYVNDEFLGNFVRWHFIFWHFEHKSFEDWCPICRAPLGILALLEPSDPHHNLARRAVPVSNNKLRENL